MCVCVCVYQRTFTPATNDSRGFLIGFSWILIRGFSKNFRSKVMAWKSQYANELQLTASRFRALSGPTEDSTTGRSNVASETSYWCNRRKTSEIQATAY